VRDAALRVLPSTQLLYVFGSHARGMAVVKSDLDLAVLAGAAMDPIQLFAARQSLELALGTDVDLVDLAAANTVLRLEVIRSGKLLHQRNAEQALQFEAQVLGEYAEWMDATRSLRAAIHQRGTVYAT
jgi:predicted nucleotidyltransferase